MCDVSTNNIIAYVGLGSNMGNRAEYLEQAMQHINKKEGLQIVASSPIYQTEPQGLIGYTEDDWFCNQVVRLECSADWNCSDLMTFFIQTEAALGRIRDENMRYTSRIIDIDLLLFGQKTSKNPHCILPHPRMYERAFVLIPLLDVLTEDATQERKKIDNALLNLPYSLNGDRIYQHSIL